MLGQQLSAIAAAALDGRPVEGLALAADLRDSDLFLTKGALKSVDAAALRQLRKRHNRMMRCGKRVCPGTPSRSPGVHGSGL